RLALAGDSAGGALCA
ncbi:hypothetical protein MKD33_01660, partial [Chromobacterium piscinae]